MPCGVSFASNSERSSQLSWPNSKNAWLPSDSAWRTKRYQLLAKKLSLSMLSPPTSNTLSISSKGVEDFIILKREYHKSGLIQNIFFRVRVCTWQGHRCYFSYFSPYTQTLLNTYYSSFKWSSGAVSILFITLLVSLLIGWLAVVVTEIAA